MAYICQFIIVITFAYKENQGKELLVSYSEC
jgi:hypothetical protein